MVTSKMLQLSILCLLSISMSTACSAIVQNTTPVDSNKAYLDVNDIVAFWQDAYCNLKFTKVAYVERTADEESSSALPFKRFRQLFAERIEDGPLIRVNTIIDDGNGLKSPNHDEYTYDGNQTSIYFGKIKRATVKPGISDDDKRNLLSPNEMLQYMLLDIQVGITKEGAPDFSSGTKRLLWYLKVRKTAENPKVLPVLETVSGYTCHVVQVSKTVKIWFAHEKSMLPMKFSINQPQYKEEIIVEKIASVETNKGTVWYPVLAKRHMEDPSIGKVTLQLEVKEFQPNASVDRSVFRPNFPKGTQVRDEVKGVSYVIGLDDVNQLRKVRKLNK